VEDSNVGLPGAKQGLSNQAAQNPTQIGRDSTVTDVELQRIADDLRSRLSADECRRLADLLTAEHTPKGDQ